jgi:hypothetical protein
MIEELMGARPWYERHQAGNQVDGAEGHRSDAVGNSRELHLMDTLRHIGRR